MDYGDPVAITAARDAAIAALAESIVNRRVSYDVDGQKVSWNEYRAGLMQTIKDLNALLVTIDAQTSGAGSEETQMI